MVQYESATAERRGSLFALMWNSASDYLNRSLDLLDMTREEFRRRFEETGEVVSIRTDGRVAGFYWVERRGSVLHLHGLVLKAEFRGRGIGTETLRELESRFGDEVSTIELGVHESNTGAIRLYEREGYETVETLDDLGFEVMQKQIRP